MLDITPAARDRIRAALEAADPPRSHVRIHASPGAKGFEYRIAAADPSERAPDDTVLSFDTFHVLIDPDSGGWLAGARLDYRETLLERGFRFDNPNPPPTPSLPTGARNDLTGSVADRVRFLLDTEINPAVAAHGGRVELAGIDAGIVYLSFGGGCHGCGLVDVTLKQGIEARPRELVPEIEQVVDTTDHAAGANPFYR